MENPLYFCMPSRVLLEMGARRRVAPLCQSQGWRHALLVTDAFFAGKTSVVRDLVEDLAAHGIACTVYAAGQPDPSTTLCDQATAEITAQPGSDGIDHLIALGGGSNIDLAKAMSLTVRFRLPVASFVGHTRWPGLPLPLVAMPTTSGTGSEITPGSILVHPENSTKVAVMGNSLRPFMAAIDPELTMSCPPRVTADAGMDALCHAIESWLTTDSADFPVGDDPDPGYSGRNRVTTLFARESVALCFTHLERCYRTPDDTEARTGMAYASLLAALSYGSAGLHAVHGLAYALAGLTHASHGSTNAVLLPYVMDALVPYRTGELADIARLAGEAGMAKTRLARSACTHVRDLVTRLGIAGNLKDFGIGAGDLPRLVRDGLAVTRLAKACPVPSVDAIYANIVNNAFLGRLAGD